MIIETSLLSQAIFGIISFLGDLWNMIIGNFILAIPVFIMLIYAALAVYDKVKKFVK